jgi:hypothetical protein
MTNRQAHALLKKARAAYRLGWYGTVQTIIRQLKANHYTVFYNNGADGPYAVLSFEQIRSYENAEN